MDMAAPAAMGIEMQKESNDELSLVVSTTADTADEKPDTRPEQTYRLERT